MERKLGAESCPHTASDGAEPHGCVRQVRPAVARGHAMAVTLDRARRSHAIGPAWPTDGIALRGRTAPVAQLDRAPDFESGGQGFESLPARQKYASFSRR